MITRTEEILLLMIEQADGLNTKAMILQAYIQEYGPVNEEAGDRIREILRNANPNPKVAR